MKALFFHEEYDYVFIILIQKRLDIEGPNTKQIYCFVKVLNYTVQVTSLNVTCQRDSGRYVYPWQPAQLLCIAWADGKCNVSHYQKGK